MVLFWGLDFGHGDRSEGAWGRSRAKSILLRFQGFMQLTDALGKRVQRTLKSRAGLSVQGTAKAREWTS